MKKSLIVLAIVALAGCASVNKDTASTDKKDQPTTAKAESTEPRIVSKVPENIGSRSQNADAPKSQKKMSNSFSNQGVRFEWTCELSNKDGTCLKGEPNAIEVTASANISGNSEASKQAAIRVAELRAKAKLRHFIHEEIFSTNTVNTLSKTVERVNEKAKDSLSEDVSMSDDEAKKDGNFITRDSSNRIVKNVTETIRANATGILRGVYMMDIQMNEGRNISVTVRWDRGSENISNYLHNKFGN